MSIKDASYAQKLTVKDNMIVNEQEKPVRLQGIMVPEVRRLDQEGKFNKEYFEEVFACSGNVIVFLFIQTIGNKMNTIYGDI